MKKSALSIAFILVCSIAFAQPVPPAAIYSEVYTIADCLNSYEGTTCIITGKVTGMDTVYHHDRYIIKDSTGEMSANFSHHVIGNYTDITSGNASELCGRNYSPRLWQVSCQHVSGRALSPEGV